MGNTMITKEMIRNGFRTGTVSIEDEYAECSGLCCRVCDNAFYFIDSEDEDITTEEYWKTYTLDTTVNMLFDILKDVESAEEHGLTNEEYNFYVTVLQN